MLDGPIGLDKTGDTEMVQSLLEGKAQYLALLVFVKILRDK